jgi:hypothetical protein
MIICVIIPSLILAKGGQYLPWEPRHILFVALAFPLSAGIYEYIRFKKKDFISIFGIASTLLSGGFSLMELSPRWFAVKEAAIPGLIGMFVIATLNRPKPLVHHLIYNEKVIDILRVDVALRERQQMSEFATLMKSTTLILATSFFISAALNFGLAIAILKSAPGTPAFNEELGRMTALSWPVIVLPSMAVMMIAVWRLISGLRHLTGLTLEEIVAKPPAQK